MFAWEIVWERKCNELHHSKPIPQLRLGQGAAIKALLRLSSCERWLFALLVHRERAQPNLRSCWYAVVFESSNSCRFLIAPLIPSCFPLTFTALWLNGGPGSSSLIGLLTELGQFQTNDDSLNTTGTPKLFYNPNSWNKVANVIFLESPKGVGFSYCTNHLNCINTDESTAEDAYDALVYIYIWINKCFVFLNIQNIRCIVYVNRCETERIKE